MVMFLKFFRHCIFHVSNFCSESAKGQGTTHHSECYLIWETRAQNNLLVGTWMGLTLYFWLLCVADLFCSILVFL